MKYRFTLLAALLATCLSINAQNKAKIMVSNPLGQQRTEIAEAELAKIYAKTGASNGNIVVTNAEGKEIPSQVTYDGKLLFQANVTAKGKSVYYATSGMPGKYETKAKGRLFVERQDEFGWENDKVAYRVYGHGGAVGYDLFNKNTSELMLDYWYASEQNQEMRSVSKQLHDRGYHDLADQVYNAYCYHIDHGKGMDCYTVGPTLGGGANALVNADGSLFMPKCYKSFEILDNGPLRFTVRFTYPEQEFDGEKITETRVISLDAGSHFNRVSVSYNGLTKPVKVAAGTVVHKSNPTAYVLSSENGYIGYENLGDASVYNAKYRDRLAEEMGKIYIGLLFPDRNISCGYQERANGIATGHVLATKNCQPSACITYYFGSGWNKNSETNFKSLADWEAFLCEKAQSVRTPLKVTVK